MEISRKTDYALRMLAELVEHEGEVVSVRLVAEKRDVPYSFARSIQRELTAAGLIESLRGSKGGMRLLADPRHTTIRTVVEALQGPILLADCDRAGVDNGPCPFIESCHFNPVWCEAQKMLVRYFDSITIYEVVCEHKHPIMAPGEAFVTVAPREEG